MLQKNEYLALVVLDNSRLVNYLFHWWYMGTQVYVFNTKSWPTLCRLVLYKTNVDLSLIIDVPIISK